MAEELTVIHYSGGLKRVNGRFTSVREEAIKVSDLLKKEMYAVVYDREYSPSDVVYRAKSRIGEHRYNPFSRNCEHFARWCKVGKEKCDQVKALGGKMIKSAASAISGFSQEGVIAGAAVVMDGLPFKEVCKVGVRSACSRLGLHRGIQRSTSISGGAVACNVVINLAAEAALFGYCIWSARKQYKNGEISKADFQKEVCRIGGECGGGFVAGTGGGIIGQLLIPVPFLGGCVGCILGNIIGRYLGGLVGQKVGEASFKEK